MDIQNPGEANPQEESVINNTQTTPAELPDDDLKSVTGGSSKSSPRSTRRISSKAVEPSTLKSCRNAACRIAMSSIHASMRDACGCSKAD